MELGDKVALKASNLSYGEQRRLEISRALASDPKMLLLDEPAAGMNTTTLHCISGLLGKISGGEIRFMGKRIDGHKGHDIAGMGLAQCLEGRHVFGNLTVKENLQMGAYLRKDADGVKQDFEYVYNLFPRLKERENQGAKTLSGGEQQMLAVGRALMQKPKLLMMDEPSLGLAPLVIQEIFNTIKRINADGIPILLIEQNSNAALKVANRGYVIENGHIVLADTSANLLANEDVKKAYLGGEKIR